MTEQQNFASMLGEAAIVVWGDMPRDIQEALFETAMRNRSELRHDLARLLHERHPRTQHPPKPA
jgi:citrate synthase